MNHENCNSSKSFHHGELYSLCTILDMTFPRVLKKDMWEGGAFLWLVKCEKFVSAEKSRSMKSTQKYMSNL